MALYTIIPDQHRTGTQMTHGSTNGGGRATAAGLLFQSRVTAFYSVAVLCESEAGPPFDLAPSTTLESIHSETGQPIDDLLIRNSAGGHIFVQAKRSLTLSGAANSPLRSVADQFARQYLANRHETTPARPWMAPLDLRRDRLVAAIGPGSSGSVRLSLAGVLASVRRLLPHQPLSDAPSNEAQTQALEIFADNLRGAWRAAIGVPPSDSELRLLLSLSHVCTLAVEAGGAEENLAKDNLRRSVLANPTEANAAWDCLISHATGLAAHGWGATRADLQQVLVTAGITLKVPRSYQPDIERLRASTSRSLQLLEPLSDIRVGRHRIHLERASSQRLSQAALGGSMLVVGEPGAGKSGCIRDFCINAQRAGHDVVLVLVDRLDYQGGDSIGSEMGLDHDLVDVLNSWPSTNLGLLVLDALDAARDERVSRKVRETITVLQNRPTRWHLVASIRKFDLRYSAELAAMFPGTGVAPYADPEFSRTAHLDVPRLSDDEILDVRNQSPQLASLLDVATTALRELLKVPFNLRLAGELVGDGISTTALSPVKSQLELLDRYWRQRVLTGGHKGEARERVLRDVCEQMVASRMLQADRASLTTSAEGLQDLLSLNVLTEWQSRPTADHDRYRIGFSHHVLFDYAVSRLLLRVSEGSLLTRMKQVPEFVLLARPSLDLHFKHLWENSRDSFWSLTFALLREGELPRISGLIGPSVVAGLASTLADLLPLIEASRAPATASVGASALRHIVTSLLTMQTKVAGVTAGPWCRLAHALAPTVSPDTVGALRVLLARAVDDDKALTEEQRLLVNGTGEMLLRFAWAQATNSAIAGMALQAVSRTFSSRPTESEALIRDTIHRRHLADRGYLDLPWLAREVEALFPYAPSLVADIYDAAFSYEEMSEERTPLGKSQILSIVSHRAQDYRHALWLLADAFPKFMEGAPREGVRAALAAIEHYVRREARVLHREVDEVETFTYRGKTVRFRRDYSAIWDEGSTRQHDEPVRILGALHDRLGALAEQGDKTGLDTCLDEVAIHASSAVTWRRLLDAAVERGGLLSDAVSELCLSTPVLVALDTTDAVGRFLVARFAELPDERKAAIEGAILAISRRASDDDDEVSGRIRARLLGCLPEAAIVHPEVRDILSALRAGPGVPSNVRPFQISGFRGRPYTTDDWLRDTGVAVDDPPNRFILDLIAPVRDSTSGNTAVASNKDVVELLPNLRTLQLALGSDRAAGAEQATVDAAWGYIARACDHAARVGRISSSTEPGATITVLLLEASKNGQPIFDDSTNAQFESSPSWGSPAARIDAASGLLLLSQGESSVSNEVLDVIARLSSDPVSAVRFQVALGLRALFKAMPEFVWTIATQMATTDPSQTVVEALLAHTLGPLAALDTGRVVTLALSIFERFKDTEPRHDCRKSVIALLLELYVYWNDTRARGFVLDIAARIGTSPSDAHALIAPSRDALIYGADDEATRIRRRAIDLMTELARGSVAAFHGFETQYQSKDAADWPEGVLERAKAAAEIAVEIAEQVYFGSGAYALERSSNSDEDVPPPAIRTRLYSEAKDLVDALVEIGLVPSAQHLIKFLESFIDTDPRGVFLRIAATVRASGARGYPQESLAADLVVRIVQRYLADYRGLLRADTECRAALIALLDAFVDAGWTSASALTYRLEDLFR